MYSPKVILATYDDFERQNGWSPVEHTVDEVEEFNAYIESITDTNKSAGGQRTTFFWKDGKPPNGNKLQFIRRWVENEQFCCFANAEYFATRYGYIRDVEERVIHFKHRVAQRIFHDALAECDENQSPIQFLILKARQLGCSTVVALYFLHRILFRSNTYAVMASVQAQQSEKLAAMLELTYNRLPFWLSPFKTSTKAKEPRWENGSSLSIQSGTQEVGIAQGTTPTAIHICLAPETMIHLGDGEIEQIQNATPGSEVITSRGRLAKVRSVVLSPRPPEMACELTLWGNYNPLVVTRDHPILTPSGFRHSEDIVKGDFVCVPVRPIRDTVKSFEIEHSPAGYYGHGRHRNTKIETIKLNRDWGWLCGLYLAEGSVHKNVRLDAVDSMTFSVHQKEIERTMNQIHQAVGMFQKVKSYSSKKSLSANVTIYNAALSRWMGENFGSVAGEKTIPDWVFNAGNDFGEGLVKGYIEGDGHISSRMWEIPCHSISMSLIIQLRDLIASLGFGWSSVHHKESGKYFGRNCKEQWSLQCSGVTARELRKRFGWENPSCGDASYSASRRAQNWDYSGDGKFINVKVFSNRPVFREKFYDLEVDAPEHDFCTIHCCVKNSEVGDYKNPERVIDEGLFPACHATRSLFLVLEGTGATSSNWQRNTWDYSVNNWGKGARLKPIFIPPACARDIYPPEDWLKDNPVPEAWEPDESTRRMRRRSELFVRSEEYLRKFLGQRWEMDKEFMWYWECRHKEAVAKHTEKKMLSQFAPTPEDCFQSENDSVFANEVLEVVTKEKKKNYVAYAVTGRSILMGNENHPYAPYAGDVNDNEDRIHLHWEAADGNEYDWTLVPMKPFDDTRDDKCMDKLLIFEPPEAGEIYAIGIDTAHGLNTPNEDRSALSVHRKGRNNEPDVQVASFTSVKVNAPQMARIAAAVAVLYGTDGRGNVTSGDPLIVKFVIEQVRKAGDECQHQLKIMGFLNHHVMHRYDSKGPIIEYKGNQEGWFTREYTRPILLDRFVDAVTTRWLILNDPIIIRQLETFERKYKGQNGKAYLEHADGGHDDNIFASAMAWTTLHDFDNSALKLENRNRPAPREVEHKDEWCSQIVVIE